MLRLRASVIGAFVTSRAFLWNVAAVSGIGSIGLGQAGWGSGEVLDDGFRHLGYFFTPCDGTLRGRRAATRPRRCTSQRVAVQTCPGAPLEVIEADFFRKLLGPLPAARTRLDLAG